MKNASHGSFPIRNVKNSEFLMKHLKIELIGHHSKIYEPGKGGNNARWKTKASVKGIRETHHICRRT